MDKFNFKRLANSFNGIPIWTLLAVSSTFFILSAFSLRTNNQNMIKLRDNVFVADEQNGDVEAALKDLRQYVYSHMNTDLAAGDNAIRPPIQLKYRYERLVEAERARNGGGSGDIYGEAQGFCEQTQPSGFSGRNRIECIRQYVDENGGADAEDVSIPDDLYKFDFASPRWSPDLAGWSLVLGSLFLVIFILRFIADYVIRGKFKD